MPKLSAAALDDRRDHILRAAETCFAREGFHRTTIAGVRKEAGVSTGAIYTYFPNKEAMMRAILERARDERKQRLEGAGDGDPALVLLGLLTAVFDAQGQHAARVDVNLWAESLRNTRVKKLAVDALRAATSTVSAVVAPRLRASSATAALDAGSVASVLIALFLGLEVQTAVGVELDPGEIVRALGALFAEYLPPFAEPGRAVAHPSEKVSAREPPPKVVRLDRARSRRRARS